MCTQYKNYLKVSMVFNVFNYNKDLLKFFVLIQIKLFFHKK